MRWLLNVLKSRSFLIAFGFLLLIGLVLVLGAWFQWDWTFRLLGIIVVLILMIVVLAINFVRANNSADEIEKSIKQQAEQQLLSTRPDKKAEIEALQMQLEQAIAKLKESKLGRGKRGRAALYALPWYMFIGPPGSGKTTAIINSGLNFPIGTDRVRGVGGTRNCDWFFSDNAILLDTAGRYMTEEEDTEEWNAFLDTLKKNRPERPINGVIVGIPLPDLAVATLDEIEWHADTIRRRVDELVKRIGIRFPIYLVFTKSDMLQGFVEFFGEMTRRERDQIWGCTLTEEQYNNTGNLRTVFEQELDRLMGALINLRSARLSRSMKREERHKVYAFPLQLESVKNNLAHFIGRLFQPNPYQESPIFRGFYFTSGTQEGVPLDRVIMAMARKFDLPATGFYEFNQQEETKSYFIKEVFTDVIIPDQYLARHTSKATRQGSLMRYGAVAASAVLLILFAILATQGLVRGRVNLNQTRTVAASVGGVRWDSPRDASEELRRMEQMRTQINSLQDTPLLGLGLYRNGTVLEPASGLYVDRARSFVQAYPLRELETRMNRTTPGQRLEDSDREILYDNLKAYLLLTEEAPRLAEEANYKFLVRYLSELATDRLEPHVEGVTRGELGAQAKLLITAYVDSLQIDSLHAFAAEPNMVIRTRQTIFQRPSISGVYQQLRREGQDLLPPFTLDDAVPGRDRHLFSGGTEVSGFFTQDSWTNFVKTRIAEVSQDPGGDEWVLGREEGELPEEMRNQELMTQQLEQLYFDDYARAWRRFIESVRIVPFENVRQAARSMSDLSDPNDGPLVYLLAQVTAQTRFDNLLVGDVATQLQESVVNRAERAARRATRSNIDSGVEVENQRHPVDRQFQWLHALSADRAQSGDASPELNKVFASLQIISNELDAISGDETEAAKTAEDVLSSNGGFLNQELRTIRSQLSTFNQDARGRLFEEPVMLSWSSILGAAQGYLNERWRDTVYDPFTSAFGGQYPFDVNSGADAPIMDVEGFFNAESGAVARFLAEDLAAYIGRDGQPTKWQGRGIVLSSAAQQAIERAQGISQNLYTGGVMRLDFQLQPELPDRPANAPVPKQVYLSLHGRESTYDMGINPATDFEWPGTRGGALLSLSTQRGDMPPKSFDGDWALFRLLQEAQVIPKTRSEYDVRWPFEQPGQYTINVRYKLKTRSADNPFRNLRGFFDFRPPQRLN